MLSIVYVKMEGMEWELHSVFNEDAPGFDEFFSQASGADNQAEQVAFDLRHVLGGVEETQIIRVDTLADVPKDVSGIGRYIKVEYDLDYHGGDYSGVGETVLIPLFRVQTLGLEEAFERSMLAGSEHIIHYTPDELYDSRGERIDS